MSNTISGMSQSQSSYDLYHRQDMSHQELSLVAQQSNVFTKLQDQSLLRVSPELLVEEALSALLATMDPHASSNTMGRMVQTAIGGTLSLGGEKYGVSEQEIKGLCTTIESENFTPTEVTLPEGYSNSNVEEFGPPGILV